MTKTLQLGDNVLYTDAKRVVSSLSVTAVLINNRLDGIIPWPSSVPQNERHNANRVSFVPFNADGIPHSWRFVEEPVVEIAPEEIIIESVPETIPESIPETESPEASTQSASTEGVA